MKAKPSEVDALVQTAERRIEFLKIELKKAEEELARLNREKESAPRLNIICEQNDLFSSKSPADGVGKGISVIPETRIKRRPIHSTTRHISWKPASYLRSRPLMGR